MSVLKSRVARFKNKKNKTITMKGTVKLSEILLLVTTIALLWMLHKQEQKKEKTISIYLPVDTMQKSIKQIYHHL